MFVDNEDRLGETSAVTGPLELDETLILIGFAPVVARALVEKEMPHHPEGASEIQHNKRITKSRSGVASYHQLTTLTL